MFKKIKILTNIMLKKIEQRDCKEKRSSGEICIKLIFTTNLTSLAPSWGPALRLYLLILEKF